MLGSVFCSLWVLTPPAEIPKGQNKFKGSELRQVFVLDQDHTLSERSNVKHQEGYMKTVNLFEFSHALPY